MHQPESWSAGGSSPRARPRRRRPRRAVPSAAPASAAPSLSGTGEVVVPDVGGALAEAFKKAYFDPFEKATGIKITLNAGNFDASVVLAQTLAGAPPYDLNNPNGATVEQYMQRRMRAGRLLALGQRQQG